LILTFDLDDTLYEEITYVKSGLSSVSNYLYKKYSIPKKDSMLFFNKELSKDRNKILDKALIKFNIFSKKEVKKCLSIYRSHTPKIKLHSQANQVFRKFSEETIYIITDGNKIVQKNKIEALGISKKVKSCIITSNYGLKHSKPSPYCFLQICKKENIQPNELVYIGDNPNKDFVGIKKLGFKTIRILSGRYKNVKKSNEYEAEITIKSLSQITKKLIHSTMKEKCI
jgi:putative hydrolase of the HAD superfamily